MGVAIGGRGPGSTFGDFRVKSLDEIRAEKRGRQQGDKTAKKTGILSICT